MPEWLKVDFMFTSLAPETRYKPLLSTLADTMSGLASIPTVIAGALIGSALAGRLFAFLAGGTSVSQLLALLVISSLALVTGYLASEGAISGTHNATLAKMAFRAGGVQTVLAVVTLCLALV